MESIFDEPLYRFGIDLFCVFVGGVIACLISRDVNRGGDT